MRIRDQASRALERMDIDEDSVEVPRGLTTRVRRLIGLRRPGKNFCIFHRLIFAGSSNEPRSTIDDMFIGESAPLDVDGEFSALNNKK